MSDISTSRNSEVMISDLFIEPDSEVQGCGDYLGDDARVLLSEILRDNHDGVLHVSHVLGRLDEFLLHNFSRLVPEKSGQKI